jgi:hypothetical protein
MSEGKEKPRLGQRALDGLSRVFEWTEDGWRYVSDNPADLAKQPFRGLRPGAEPHAIEKPQPTTWEPWQWEQFRKNIKHVFGKGD